MGHQGAFVASRDGLLVAHRDDASDLEPHDSHAEGVNGYEHRCVNVSVSWLSVTPVVVGSLF